MACICCRTLLYRAQHPKVLHTRRFGARLTPGHYRRRNARPVSYYALFKWWLLLSQHPGCHGIPTSFLTKTSLGTLAGGLGCFPLDREAYPSRTDSRDSRNGIRSLVPQGRREAPQTDSVALPPLRSGPRLALKLFRGERAIAEFDETFTPPHSSSPRFSTLVGSVLHAVLPALQPGHG
jgi:hypothetical protein